MKIERVDLIRVRMPLIASFETSYGRLLELDKLILKVYTPDGSVYSECVAGTTPFYTYETVETVYYVLKAFLIPSIIYKELDGPEHFNELISRFRGHLMAKAVIENALWTIKAEEEGLSLARTLGGQKRKIVSGVSIGIQGEVGELIHLIAFYLDKGYPRIKIKIKPGKDLHVTEAVRKQYPQIQLMVDANNAYGFEDLALFKAMDNLELMMIEQPLGSDNLLDHARLQEKLKTSVCLDESIHGPASAQMAGALRACRIINIKQGSMGGLSQARKVHDMAQNYDMGVWCGGMLETGIGRAYNVALAALSNFVFPNDISASDRYWERDIIESPFALNPDGTIDVPSVPGLGVSVNEKELQRVTVARETYRV